MCNLLLHTSSPVRKTVEANARWSLISLGHWRAMLSNAQWTPHVSRKSCVKLTAASPSQSWLTHAAVCFTGAPLRHSLKCQWTPYDHLWEKRPRKSLAFLEETACFLLVDNENVSDQLFCFWLLSISATDLLLDYGNCDLFPLHLVPTWS